MGTDFLRLSRTMTLTALFAAMITLTTAYFFHIPVGTGGGYIHLGDAFIYLAASFLPTPYACAAACLGGSLADLLSGSLLWMVPTALIKPLTVLCFTARGNRLLCTRNLLALPAAGIITMGGYYLAEVLLFGSWSAPLVSLGANLIQAVGSSLVYLLMALALDGVHLKSHLKFL